MSAPTPGPWRLEQNSAGQWCVIGAGELVVCMFPPIVAEIADEQMANMAAIAAASKMLYAIRGLEPYLDAIVCFASTMNEHEPNRLAHEARLAIDKATWGNQ